VLAPLLALGSAVMYGAADFLGGLAARRTNAVAVVFGVQLSGMVALVILLPWLPDAAPTARDLAWGSAAGLAIGAGLALLYRALALGSMAVVAPTSAVCAVVLPVMGAVLLGERPGARALLGILLAIVSIVLVSRRRTQAAPGERGPRRLPSGFGLALLSGVGVGLFFLALARAAPGAGLWPVLVARVVSVASLGAGAWAGGRSLRLTAPVATIVITGGVLDVFANALYLLATHHGPLSVVVTLSSLYPASTVVLSLVVLGERFSALQGAGIACALVAVLLIVGS
jgi:drug/metabolite transporter (DMT)-like permease